MSDIYFTGESMIGRGKISDAYYNNYNTDSYPIQKYTSINQLYQHIKESDNINNSSWFTTLASNRGYCFIDETKKDEFISEYHDISNDDFEKIPIKVDNKQIYRLKKNKGIIPKLRWGSTNGTRNISNTANLDSGYRDTIQEVAFRNDGPKSHFFIICQGEGGGGGAGAAWNSNPFSWRDSAGQSACSGETIFYITSFNGLGNSGYASFDISRTGFGGQKEWGNHHAADNKLQAPNGQKGSDAIFTMVNNELSSSKDYSALGGPGGYGGLVDPDMPKNSFTENDVQKWISKDKKYFANFYYPTLFEYQLGGCKHKAEDYNNQWDVYVVDSIERFGSGKFKDNGNGCLDVWNADKLLQNDWSFSMTYLYNFNYKSYLGFDLTKPGKDGTETVTAIHNDTTYGIGARKNDSTDYIRCPGGGGGSLFGYGGDGYHQSNTAAGDAGAGWNYTDKTGIFTTHGFGAGGAGAFAHDYVAAGGHGSPGFIAIIG